MLLLLFACTTPEELSIAHANIVCSYLDECQLLQTFDYESTDACLENEESLAFLRTKTEDDALLLEECNESLKSIECSAVYEQEYFLTEKCSIWLEATEEQVASQE